MSKYTMNMYVFKPDLDIEAQTRDSAERKLAKVLSHPDLWDSYIDGKPEVFTAEEREEMDHLCCPNFPNCDIAGCGKS